MNKSQLTATVIKSDDLPEDVAKAGDGKDVDKWFWATVEIPDHEGDIVRVKGIDLTHFAREGNPIKFISSHSRKPGPDGKLPVVGKAVEWVQTVHKSANAPALAVGIKFAPTDLGKEMKALYDGDFLTDVSIGFQPKKSTPIDGGGFDYSESALSELSACISGMNQFAGVMRALETEDGILPPLDLDRTVDNLFAAFSSMSRETGQQLLTILSRLDDIEDSIVGKANDAPAGSPAEQPIPQPDADKASVLLEALNRVLKR